MQQFERHIPKYLLNSTSTFLAISNLQGKCLFLNPCLQEFLGKVEHTRAKEIFPEFFKSTKIEEIIGQLQ